MSRENEKKWELKKQIWLAVIGILGAIAVAWLNKGQGEKPEPQPGGDVNVTVTTNETRKNDSPEVRAPLPPRPTPPTPLPFDKAKVLRELDAHIRRSEGVLKNNQDVDIYNSWRAECGFFLERKNLSKFARYADSLARKVPSIEEGGRFHMVETSVNEGVKILKSLREEIKSAH